MYHGFACHVETNPQHPSITSIGCHLNWMSLLLLLSREFFPSLIFLRLQTFFDISHKCTCWWCWCEESKLYKSDKTCQHSNVVTRNYWVATAICYHRKYHLSQKQGFRPRKIKAKGRELGWVWNIWGISMNAHLLSSLPVPPPARIEVLNRPWKLNCIAV